MAKDEQGTRDWGWVALAVGGVALVVAVYAGLLTFPDGDLAAFGQRGDAMAPVAALLSLVAVVVALRSVDLQRKELALQRQEMRQARAEMAKQAEHLAKAADAQDRLASAQRLLAIAQGQANELTKVQVISASLQSHIQTEVAYFEAYATHAMGKSGALRHSFDVEEHATADPGTTQARLFERLRAARVLAKRHYEEMQSIAKLPPLGAPENDDA